MKVGLPMFLGVGSEPPNVSGGTASLNVCHSHSSIWLSAFLAILSRLVSLCNRSFKFRSNSRKFSSRLSPEVCRCSTGCVELSWGDASAAAGRTLAVASDTSLEGVVLVGMPN